MDAGKLMSTHMWTFRKGTIADWIGAVRVNQLSWLARHQKEEYKTVTTLNCRTVAWGFIY